VFVQIIQGALAAHADRQDLKEALDRWEREVRPGAVGWLGSTAGVTDDGTSFALVRFESAEAARRNSDRPEQHQWWTETSKLFGGEVTFHDCSDVDLMAGGGSDDAGFVQVIQGRIRDLDGLRAYLRDLDEQAMKDFRPDVIGSIAAYHPDGGFTEAVYFTSEAEAREGERKEPPEELRDEMNKMMSFYEGDWTYLDLREPWLSSP
jgi:hypothetical protein